jgi:hypothetical protein
MGVNRAVSLWRSLGFAGVWLACAGLAGAQEIPGDGLPDCAIGDRLVECASPDPCAGNPGAPGCGAPPAAGECEGEGALTNPICAQFFDVDPGSRTRAPGDCASSEDVAVARERFAPIRDLAPVLRDELVLLAFLNGAAVNPGGKSVADEDTEVNRLISGVRSRVADLGGEQGCTVADVGVGSCLSFIEDKIARDQKDLRTLSSKLLLPVRDNTDSRCDADPESGEVRTILGMLSRFQDALRAADVLSARFVADRPPDPDVRVRCDDLEQARNCEFLERRVSAASATATRPGSE